ncbi:MAG: HD domain-containing phosphohydrolase [Candidatus Krumholzibacteria bacterium]
MAKTLVEKVTSSNPDVSIFKISGTLGFHENQVLVKFFKECAKKKISKLIMDFSELSSLGGGCAKIIRETAHGGAVVICVAGASTRVKSFLTSKGENEVLFQPDLEKALKAVEVAPKTSSGKDAAPDKETHATPGKQTAADTASAADTPKKAATETSDKKEPAQAASKVKSKQAPTGKHAPATDEKELKRKLLQYRSLLSLNTDFNRIPDKTGLLDAFLLTTIAQVGVEAAAFLERSGADFVAVSWKGFETADPGSLKIAIDQVDVEKWLEKPDVFGLDESPIRDSGRKGLKKWDMPYVAPFIVNGELMAIVVIGKAIRKEPDENSWEFLGMLINQAAVAYANSSRFEAESSRTLGLVRSLISMIEENTMSRGSTEAMANYIHAVGVEVHYPEEHMRNLIYGTVLRDIGMIKVSDLIVRSPRELEQEEWGIIKRHPTEGAEMLKSMDFSQHTCDIVASHHERFNGEGYPRGIQGPQIPLGARILSVVESYEAMLQDRPTRPALSQEEALNTLKENWGNRYDPDIVEQFLEIVEEEIRSGEAAKYRGSELFKV